MLVGGTRHERVETYRRRYFGAPLLALAESYRALAARYGLSLLTLAYGWVAGRPGVDSVLCGPGSVAHLDAAIDGCAQALEPALNAEIDALHRAYLGSDAS